MNLDRRFLLKYAKVTQKALRFSMHVVSLRILKGSQAVRKLSNENNAYTRSSAQ